MTRLLIFLDVTTGLRQSELFGLRWSDLDFDNGEISVVRSVVHGVISRCKTESSAKPIPMGPLLAEMLMEWRKVTRYRSADDSTLLRQLGTDIKVQQDLLRHSSARLTLDTYTQAVTPANREAQNAVVQLLLSVQSEAVVAPTTTTT